MYGALNNISDEVLEAARIDGAGPWRTAIHIQIPMIRKWIVYLAILAFASGTQLFVEPQLLQTASLAGSRRPGRPTNSPTSTRSSTATSTAPPRSRSCCSSSACSAPVCW